MFNIYLNGAFTGPFAACSFYNKGCEEEAIIPKQSSFPKCLFSRDVFVVVAVGCCLSSLYGWVDEFAPFHWLHLIFSTLKTGWTNLIRAPFGSLSLYLSIFPPLGSATTGNGIFPRLTAATLICFVSWFSLCFSLVCLFVCLFFRASQKQL